MVNHVQVFPAHKPSSQDRVLRMLQRLCNGAKDSTFLAYLLGFVSTDFALRTFRTWSEESVQAERLAGLGAALVLRPGDFPRAKSSNPALLVRQMLGRGMLSTQYPAALLAARAPVAAPPTSEWIQRLRCYWLIRALDAVEAGFAREAHLERTAALIRQASETSDNQHIRFLTTLVGSAYGFHGFETEGLLAVRRAQPALPTDTPHVHRQFLRDLQSLLEYAPFTPGGGSGHAQSELGDDAMPESELGRHDKDGPENPRFTELALSTVRVKAYESPRVQ